MNYLKDKRLYLGGPIEYSTLAADWREYPKKVLAKEFGLNVFDPFSDPKQQWVEDIAKARTNRDYATIVKIARKFVRKDLSVVDRCDVNVSYLPYKVPTTGTHHEIINSNDRKKPTLLVSDSNDIAYLPVWYFGFIPLEFMFPNWDSLFEYLRKVDSSAEVHERWNFVQGQL